MISRCVQTNVMNRLTVLTALCFFAVELNSVESKMMAYYGPIPEAERGAPPHPYYYVITVMKRIHQPCRNEAQTIFQPTSFGKPIGISTKPAVSTPVEKSGCSIDSEEPLGMASGAILDSDITASSSVTSNPPANARLNTGASASAWIARSNDVSLWIEVSFRTTKYITGLTTGGIARDINGRSHWVEKYEVEYSHDDRRSWHRVAGKSSQYRFVGNSDGESLKTNKFKAVLETQILRIVAYQYVSRCALRFEVLGCDV